MWHTTHPHRGSRFLRPWLVVTALAAAPAGADWLITLDGRMIETRGPWTVSGDRLSYVALDGAEHTLSVDEVDLEGSQETTALRAGKPYPPLEEPTEPEPRPGPKSRTRKAGKPKVLLYVGNLCRSCTRARELLEELGVEFKVRDVDVSIRARREYKKKAGHGGGLPIIDVDGTVIYTFHPRVVREKIEAFLDREAALASEATEEHPGEVEKSVDG